MMTLTVMKKDETDSYTQGLRIAHVGCVKREGMESWRTRPWSKRSEYTIASKDSPWQRDSKETVMGLEILPCTLLANEYAHVFWDPMLMSILSHICIEITARLPPSDSISATRRQPKHCHGTMVLEWSSSSMRGCTRLRCDTCELSMKSAVQRITAWMHTEVRRWH